MKSSIKRAAELLKQGKLVAFPTETVYGLGADASNPSAIAKIFQAKGRPANHPLIVHLANSEQMTAWARDIPAAAWQLAKHFWPGPLTLILKCAANISDVVTGGQDTVGLRVPAHPVAHELLTQFGGGIAAPSANKFGRISPTQAAHVKQELGDAVDLILDGGACTLGIESTIIDLSSETPRILRLGSVLPEQLAAVLQTTVPIISASINRKNTPQVSGMLLSHYAPITPLKIVTSENLLKEVSQLLNSDNRFSVLAYSVTNDMKHKNLTWFTLAAEPNQYAHDFYATLRAADALQGNVILVEAVPIAEGWLALGDRLQKATAAT